MYGLWVLTAEAIGEAIVVARHGRISRHLGRPSRSMEACDGFDR